MTPSDAGPSETPVIVVGGTGILAPAAQALRDNGQAVVVVARGRTEHSQVQPDLQFDARDGRAWMANPGWRGCSVIAYEPALSEESRAVLTEGTRGPRVLVRTSGCAAPSAGASGSFVIRPIDGWTTLVLGWTTHRTWHSPSDISRAALEAWASGRSGVLGVVRPWDQRP